MLINVQPAFNAGPSNAAQSIDFPTQSGGTSPGAGEAVRSDWNVRMNCSHKAGFVGGAGRLLVHNMHADEIRELAFLLPAAMADKPGRLELASASVCSAKPGISAAQGQSLAVRTEGPVAFVTVPTLGLNDWVYIDITWTGAFAEGGESFAGGQVPLGDFHPQLGHETTTDTGQRALHPHSARYDVELGGDVGSSVRLEASEHAGVESSASDDGTMTMHRFKSYGAPRIDGWLRPPGAMG